MKNPKISVVIPVKNEERVIGKCLEAIFSQSMKPFEVIIVDGHSSDKTAEEARARPEYLRVVIDKGSPQYLKSDVIYVLPEGDH